MEQASWIETAKKLRFERGKSWTETAREMKPFFPELDEKQIWEKVRSALRRTTEYSESQQTTEEQPEIKPQKTDIVQNFEPTITRGEWNGQRTIKFALMGDTQINSKYTQLTHLHDFYDICEDAGIKDVYNVGDIDEGERMREGHAYECYRQGADDHVDEIVRVYPKRDGVTTHFITGNHDASMMKHCGYDIGRSIAEKRPDMHYLGRDCAVIELTPNCTLELRHPWDGTAYALSYKIQKMIEAMSGGEKPNILAVGHYHKIEYLPYRNVHAFQTGCFQAQTPFMRGKSIAAMMGGWIVEVDVASDGSIRRLRQELVPFYVPIKDDYKNFSNW